MKSNTTILVLGVALTVVAGLFSSAVFGLIGSKTDEQSTASATGLITGHVTTIHKDSAGNILGYRQSDNMIVNQGENCTLKLLFQLSTGAAGNTVCTGMNTIGYRYIAIGNSSVTSGTPGAVVSTDYKLVNPYNNTSSSGLGRALGVVATNGWSNNTSSSSVTAASVVMSATFQNLSGGARNVNESGLFNNTDGNTDTDSMFARQVFSTISLNNNDSLTVQWTVNVGGTASITAQS
jgi:hypothetical protein